MDHSTLCAFRKRFRRELKDFVRHLGRLAIGVVRLNWVASYGPLARNSSNQFSTTTIWKRRVG